MRVCFLFNHFSTHHVAHSAPFAFELSRRYEKAAVVVAFTSEEQREALVRVASRYPGHRAEFVKLEIPALQRWAARALSRLTFLAKRRTLANNLEFFARFDAIVAPERTMVLLRTRYGLPDVKLINTRHGQGDREGSVDERMLDVDLTLVAGRKYADRFSRRGLLRPGHYAIVGYPKFEVCEPHREKLKLFPDDRPVVLYNPHFDWRESSWSTLGHEVLAWFGAHPEYNLVFAPHVVLFARAWRHRARLARRVRGFPNVRIDLGSEASVDMTYTYAADIYLGDASSQVYEFIKDPRPCVFLDAQHARGRDPERYAHWRFGPVITSIGELGIALRAAQEGWPTYEAEQRAGFSYTFSSEPEFTAAQRGADAIAEYLTEGAISSARFLR